MVAQAAANVEAVSAGDHDVQQEKRRGLTFGVGNDVGGGAVDPDGEAGGFQMVLDQARDIRVVLKNKNNLAQPIFPLPADG